MAPKTGRGRGASRGKGRQGGRGQNESQALVKDLQFQGLTREEARTALKGMGFAVSRVSQLLKGYVASTASSSQAPAVEDPETEDSDDGNNSMADEDGKMIFVFTNLAGKREEMQITDTMTVDDFLSSVAVPEQFKGNQIGLIKQGRRLAGDVVLRSQNGPMSMVVHFAAPEEDEEDHKDFKNKQHA